MTEVLIPLDRSCECGLILTMREDGKVGIRILNVPKVGKEKNISHHALRDLVKLIKGRPYEELTCEYFWAPPLGDKPQIKKKHLNLVED